MHNNFKRKYLKNMPNYLQSRYNCILLIILMTTAIIIIIIFVINVMLTCVPIGHLQPLGLHRPPIKNGVKILNYLPDPTEFWKEYIVKGKPVIFRNVAKSLNIFNLWTDNYLRLHYGHIEVTVEMQKKRKQTFRCKLNVILRIFKKISNRGIIYDNSFAF